MPTKQTVALQSVAALRISVIPARMDALPFGAEFDQSVSRAQSCWRGRRDQGLAPKAARLADISSRAKCASPAHELALSNVTARRFCDQH